MTKKCTHCKEEVKEAISIPLVAAECEASRQHEVIMRLIYAVLVLAVLLFGSNFAWLIGVGL